MEAKNVPKDGKIMDIDSRLQKPNVYRVFLRCPQGVNAHLRWQPGRRLSASGFCPFSRVDRSKKPKARAFGFLLGE